MGRGAERQPAAAEAREAGMPPSLTRSGFLARGRDDGDGDGGHHSGGRVFRGDHRRPAWPSRKPPWCRRWRSAARRRRRGRSAQAPDCRQRRQDRRGGPRVRSPPPGPPAGGASRTRPRGPPAGLDLDACCRSSCHAQGGRAAGSPDCPHARRVQSRNRRRRFRRLRAPVSFGTGGSLRFECPKRFDLRARLPTQRGAAWHVHPGRSGWRSSPSLPPWHSSHTGG